MVRQLREGMASHLELLHPAAGKARLDAELLKREAEMQGIVQTLARMPIAFGSQDMVIFPKVIA